MTIMMAVIGNATAVLAHDARMPSAGSVSSWRQNIATLDWLRSDLASGDAEAMAPWFAIGNSITVNSHLYDYSVGVPTMATTLTALATESTIMPGCSWLFNADPWFPQVYPLSSGQVTRFNTVAADAIGDNIAGLETRKRANVEPIDPGKLPLLEPLRLTPQDVSECLKAAALKVLASNATVSLVKALLPNFRQHLLRLLDSIRAALRFMFGYALGISFEQADVVSFVLLLLAASRCFGHRGDPDDHGLPVFKPMSFVVGSSAGSV